MVFEVHRSARQSTADRGSLEAQLAATLIVTQRIPDYALIICDLQSWKGTIDV